MAGNRRTTGCQFVVPPSGGILNRRFRLKPGLRTGSLLYSSRGAQPMKANLSTGDTIVLYLQNPREKIWGMLCDLSPAGANICGIDLAAFEDWLRSVTTGEGGIGLTSAFIPMWRIERITLDQDVAGVPALEDHV